MASKNGWLSMCADRTADFRNHHIRFGLFAHGIDKALDFVGDVRNHLHGLSKVFAVALFGQHIPVHFTGCQIGKLVQILIDKAFIMPQVQVGFRTVVRDVHFPVLMRRKLPSMGWK